MKTQFQEYLQYTKSERKGIYFFTLLFLLGCLIYFNLNEFVKPPTNHDPNLDKILAILGNKNAAYEENPVYKEKLETKNIAKEKSSSWNSKYKKTDNNSSTYSPLKTQTQNTYPDRPSYKKKRMISPFDFDPNTVSKDDLKKMNLPYIIINTLDKYRNKGGTFRTKEDVKKIYGLTDSIYQIIESHIQLSNVVEKAVPKKSKPMATISFFDINLSTAEELQSLKGIGPVLSSRIIKFRDKLGGFHSVDQIKSTYGLADSVFQDIKPFIQMITPVHRIDLNQADFKTLNSHPYISFQMAKVISKYKEQHGNFQSIADLKKIKILSEQKIQEIAPYLKIE